jgi:hypothetical protein
MMKLTNTEEELKLPPINDQILPKIVELPTQSPKILI